MQQPEEAAAQRPLKVSERAAAVEQFYPLPSAETQRAAEPPSAGLPAAPLRGPAPLQRAVGPQWADGSQPEVEWLPGGGSPPAARRVLSPLAGAAPLAPIRGASRPAPIV